MHVGPCQSASWICVTLQVVVEVTSSASSNSFQSGMATVGFDLSSRQLHIQRVRWDEPRKADIPD